MRYENTGVLQEKSEAIGLTMQQISTDFHDVFTDEINFKKKLYFELDATAEQVRQPVEREPIASEV